MQKRRNPDMCPPAFGRELPDAFPVSFFRFTQKNNASVILHAHGFFEIGLCLRGSGMFLIENQTLSFGQGDISFIYPNQPHIAQSPEGLPSQWIFIDVDITRLFAGDPLLAAGVWQNRDRLPRLIRPAHCESLAPVIRLFIEELEQKKTGYQEAAKALLSVFIRKITRLRGGANSGVPAMNHAFRPIVPALAYIAQNYARKITTAQLAGHCSLSETHFRALFKKAVGRPPLQYLTGIRMKMAKTLLQSTGLSILTVAQNVGYDSISSFNRTFMAWFGVTPSRCRQQNPPSEHTVRNG